MAKFRREDQRLITGQGLYTADQSLANQAHAYFLRADRAHADIVSIDTAAARALKGVLGVFTGQEVADAKLKTAPAVAFFSGKNGTKLKVPPHEALAHDRVRFVGEPVVLVVAETLAIAQDAAELVTIDYRDLTPHTTAQDAIAAGATELHADVPGNLAVEYEYGNQAATDAQFAKAAHVATVTLDAQRIMGNPLEPKSCMASFDSASGVFNVYAPTQGAADIRGVLSLIFSLPVDKIRVHSRDVGGGFGVRGEVYPEFVAVMLAARALGRTVKWTGTRAETMVGDHHARAATLTGSLALDKRGKFLGLRIDWLVNLGAYCSNAGAFINTAAAPTSTAVNLYRVPAVYGSHQLVFTNTTPTAPYRGAGRPNVSYLCERLVDEAARVTGIDRVEIRRRNMIGKEDFPYKTPTGSVYDSGDPHGLLDQVIEAADWKNFNQRRKESKKRGKLRGMGLAVFIEPSGGPGHEEIVIRFDAEGKVQLFTMAGPSGQGHETVFTAVVADVLGIAEERLDLRYNDPDAPIMVGLGSFGSRSLMSHGAALKRGADEVVRKAKELAAKELEVSPDDVRFDAGRFSIPGTDLTISLDEVVRRHTTGNEHPLNTTMKIETASSYPSGAHVAEVEIDPDTGVLEILSYIAVDDCGRMLNPAIVEGQLIGGMMQSIGQVVGEFVAYERDTGQLLTGSFMDYYMPRAAVLPDDLRLLDRSVLSPNNVLGVKGVGEAGATGAVPTLANAVMDALQREGVTHLDMPYSSHRLWAALHEARGHK